MYVSGSSGVLLAWIIRNPQLIKPTTMKPIIVTLCMVAFCHIGHSQSIASSLTLNEINERIEAENGIVSLETSEKVVSSTFINYIVIKESKYNGFSYTLVSFDEKKKVDSGIIKDQLINSNHLKKGTYALILFMGEETIVKKIEKL